MGGIVEFSIRLAIRFGALAGFVACSLIAAYALIVLAREGVRVSASSMLGIASVVTMLVLAPAAWSGAQTLAAAFSASRNAPPPSGAFAVGDQTLALQSDHADPIDVRIWYPKTDPGQKRLILYAPGVGGDRNQNALTLADLASHGYVVIAFDDPSKTPAPAAESPRDRAIREGLFDFSSPAAYAQTRQNFDQRTSAEAHKALDILDRFSAIANRAGAPWAGVDVSRVGFVGFSIGGGVAAEAALSDSRIVAVVNIDGPLFARADTDGVRVPYLVILSDGRRLSPLPRFSRDLQYLLDRRELERARAQAHNPKNEVIEVLFSEHASFTDEYFNPSYFASWLLIDPFRAHAILESRLISFLAAELPTVATPATTPPRFAEVLEFGAAP